MRPCSKSFERIPRGPPRIWGESTGSLPDPLQRTRRGSIAKSIVFARITLHGEHPMRHKGLLVTDRDLDVLKYLAYGPAFAADLHARFFVKAGKRIDRRNFEKRVRKLCDTGYVQS